MMSPAIFFFFCCEYIRFRTNILAILWLAAIRGYTLYIQTETDWRDLWSTPLRWAQVPWYTYRFHKDWFRHSKLIEWTHMHTDTRTTWRTHKPTFIFSRPGNFAKNIGTLRVCFSDTWTLYDKMYSYFLRITFVVLCIPNGFYLYCVYRTHYLVQQNKHINLMALHVGHTSPAARNLERGEGNLLRLFLHLFLFCRSSSHVWQLRIYKTR
jgi:hypothetical protein